MSSKRIVHEMTFGKRSNIRTNVGIYKPGTKTPRQLERHLKGVANHRRIQILNLVSKEPGLSLDGISTALNCDFKLISVHTSKLVHAGLLEKKYVGRMVTHTLSPYGRKILAFLKTF